MRRVFSTLLVLMLVLRGLLGDAMAMGVMPVAVHANHAAVMARGDAQDTQAMVHDETNMGHHASVSAGSQRHCADGDGFSAQHCAGGDSQVHHTATCSACDICNSSLHTATAWVQDSAVAPQSLQIAPSARFVSALPSQVVKPPIS
ncbi:hypothetical protein SDC9_134656 [bioreactor metagenome]|uniref:Uncharacterized protein n=1 Tax=bioreactor metagenome TaxID=1076179 RepID=A0A645DDW4_9ZZZZ